MALTGAGKQSMGFSLQRAGRTTFSTCNSESYKDSHNLLPHTSSSNIKENRSDVALLSWSDGLLLDEVQL